ncbi:hypothetical protein OSB04_006069 [Centaurea solstitialis]|uniref:BED-type domain-containing protein n=1 Tax=Centaurea solstitialis TaxID=347529 RepID=A0AA38TH87_9ASTR|nr:hypothetical protein OSB04_006069 [Centaurea solstitialis]
MSSGPQQSSTSVGIMKGDFPINVDEGSHEDEAIEVNEEPCEPPLNTTSKEAETTTNPFHNPKRPRRSKEWDEFLEPEMIKAQWKVRCKYCKTPLSLLKSKSTTHMHRHLESCVAKAKHMRQQKMITFCRLIQAPVQIHLDLLVPCIMENLTWGCLNGTVYLELLLERTVSKFMSLKRKKLKDLFKKVERISLTTDLWKSKPQKIEYMVITAHFVDLDWKLQKRVINFVHLPPPRTGANIADGILTCLREWEIEDKVFTISVDNASANDSCIGILKENFESNGRLVCGGRFDARLKRFVELVSQYNITHRKLVIECKTRWNSTYDMLDCAIKFRQVFPRYTLHDRNYTYCPSEAEWGKVSKLLDILKVFKDATNSISGYEYPTSNLFLAEVQRIKVMLDKQSESPDDFVKSMVTFMKVRFDKYWGECNMLMSIGTVLDPRLKMRAIEIAWPKMFPSNVARENVRKVKEVMYELFDEYVRMYSSILDESGQSEFGSNTREENGGSSGLSELLLDVFSGETSVTHVKSELDMYLEEGCFFSQDYKFDVLAWWKEKSNKYRILSRMAANILAVPITTVASEATFSAGSRVIDDYRACLAPETVQMLICTGDWCRSLHGVKGKNKESEEQPKEIIISVSSKEPASGPSDI